MAGPGTPPFAPADGDAADGWTCPFCSLLCDDLTLPAGHPTSAASACTRAQAGLASLRLEHTGAPQPRIRGQVASLDAAVTHAAQLLAASRQPLFGGMATDVNGARALVQLAGRCGAICDHANGEPLALATRVLHDQGSWMVTLGEVAARAELVVCIGSDPAARHPRFWQRIGAHLPGSPLRQVVFVGLSDDAALARQRLVDVTAQAGRSAALDIVALVAAGLGRHTDATSEPAGADLFDTVQQLALALRPRPPRGLDAHWLTLATDLRASAYSCFVWEAGVLPRHGELIAGAIQSIVATLNATTRAGSVALAGGDGAATAQQAHTWLTGLPLRTRLPSAPGGRIEHDPVQHGAHRLLTDHGCDALLWVSSLTALAPPAAAAGLPAVVLGPPALAVDGAGVPEVFIPVATPGLHHTGHLFRSDGIIAMPMDAPLRSPLPDVANVARRLSAALAGLTLTHRSEVSA